MAAHGARRLKRMTANLSVILGIEAMCAAQGIEQRAPLTTSAPLKAAMGALRKLVPTLKEDRYLAGDIEASAAMILDDTLATAAKVEITL